MTKKKSKWIQKAIKRPNALRRLAKRIRAINRDGTINLDKVEKYVKKNYKGKRRTLWLRRINLARTLKKLSRKKSKRAKIKVKRVKRAKVRRFRGKPKRRIIRRRVSKVKRIKPRRKVRKSKSRVRKRKIKRSKSRKRKK